MGKNLRDDMLPYVTVVRKGWGAEIHIVNNDKYFLKYLIFFKGKRFSYHFHSEKQELWHCIFGNFHCSLGGHNADNIYESVFQAGDKIELPIGTCHQLVAESNSLLVEVSTRDYIEDSRRIIKGD